MSYRAHFEEIERETIQIVRSLELELEELSSKLPSTELKEWFGTKEDTEAIRTEIREHERLSKAWILAMHVRAAACQLSCALPGRQHVTERRLSDIQEALNGSASWKASAHVFQDLIETRLHSPWNFKSTLDQRRQQLMSEVDSLKNWIIRNETDISETLQRVKGMIENDKNESSSPMRISVEVNSAREVIAVNRIIEAE